MKSVFGYLILTDGCYSDYQVIGIFSSKEKAETIRDTFFPFADVKELPLDPFVSEINRGLNLYRIRMNANGDTLYVSLKTMSDWNFTSILRDSVEPIAVIKNINGTGSQGLEFLKTVFARDEEHAVKIVNEMRVRWLADQRWLVSRE